MLRRLYFYDTKPCCFAVGLSSVAFDMTPFFVSIMIVLAPCSHFNGRRCIVRLEEKWNIRTVQINRLINTFRCHCVVGIQKIPGWSIPFLHNFATVCMHVIILKCKDTPLSTPITKRVKFSQAQKIHTERALGFDAMCTDLVSCIDLWDCSPKIHVIQFYFPYQNWHTNGFLHAMFSDVAVCSR